MEVFGGFMVMMSILVLFLTVVWLIMPFVVFTMKSRQDRSLELLEAIDRRLGAVERLLESRREPEPPRAAAPVTESAPPEGGELHHH